MWCGGGVWFVKRGNVGDGWRIWIGVVKLCLCFIIVNWN